MNWLDLLKSSLGSREKEAGSTSVDVASINYSMPTVAADRLTFLVPTEASFESAPHFHEDEWCQIEFLPKTGYGVKALLTQYKEFERAHRVQYGWSQVFSRELPRGVMIEGGDAVERIADLFETTPISAPILFTASCPLGQVEGGFAIRPSSDVLLYGLADQRGITALGAMLDGDDKQLSQAFAALHSAHNLLLVDWRQQFALGGVDAGGRLAIWRP
ncbi:hypothetical protein [Noviluteimonas gilva]|uniref:Uncharacterized protein n=1 Tax=Noviluteimonas gilva TaxID=2682097 RepID=A0A7C9HP90_9GAMM|nr:hypothetical protein [Lysobacter gilvus]MUV15792.1 hypothetical protein [Lysobacter gilvus]